MMLPAATDSNIPGLPMRAPFTNCTSMAAMRPDAAQIPDPAPLTSVGKSSVVMQEMEHHPMTRKAWNMHAPSMTWTGRSFPPEESDAASAKTKSESEAHIMETTRSRFRPMRSTRRVAAMLPGTLASAKYRECRYILVGSIDSNILVIQVHSPDPKDMVAHTICSGSVDRRMRSFPYSRLTPRAASLVCCSPLCIRLSVRGSVTGGFAFAASASK
mmetsp:Transcript_48007/g.145034  ORF Transcript_48007/g.145034 Transcript_48007/m.145034 type:complete len:215 (-) Transcript_48007:917-1561(-)